LPLGTYDCREITLEINSEHALRSIRVMPSLGAGVAGTVDFASISVTDAAGREYAVDPSFDEWYDSVPEELADLSEGVYKALSNSLILLQGAGATTERVFEAAGACAELRREIIKKSAENGCRRMLRDLDTVERHLGHALLALTGEGAPACNAPSTLAVGDSLAVSVVGGSRGIPREWILSFAGAENRTDGKNSVLRPVDSLKPGQNVVLHAVCYLGKGSRRLAFRLSRTVSIVQPLELELVSGGTDTATGAAVVRATVRNNRSRVLTCSLVALVPPGWTMVDAKPLVVPARATACGEVRLLPQNKNAADSVPVVICVEAGSDRAQAEITLLHLPASANLLKNPGFEKGLANWAAGKGTSVQTDANAHSGTQAVQLANPAVAQTSISQSVTLNQTQPAAVMVRAFSKAQEVSGAVGRGYSLYVDIYYTDGTPLYGRTANFKPAAEGWQMADLYIEPKKPIRNVNVYLLLRGRTGTAWFDDVQLVEDPRRVGNLARQAKLSTDGCFGTKYTVTPLT
ncbi:MAG: hypothetical protein KAI66_15510, partial [Lentisphaeria bacterium]|nr:hypothetical protein [Lentisphaeria bacterium]